ncbi:MULTISPECIES: MFS transporter [Fervidicoccus]|uniref:MFS transporter n=1 Tax=Fervidicoccus TaxID=685950 RepID=UPI0011E5050D|nr:MFS transporter [Fervidicoccus fontis]
MSASKSTSTLNRNHLEIFAIVSMSFFLDGVLFSLIPTTLYLIPSILPYASLILMLNSASFMLGSLTFGVVSDRIGRRRGLITSLSIYTISTIAFIAFSYAEKIGLIEAAILTSIINYGIGAETGPSYAALSEFMPDDHRGKMLMLALNFWNVGAAVIALLSLFYSKLTTDLNTILLYTLFSALFLSIVVLFARLHIPESPRWLVLKDRKDEAEKIAEKFPNISIITSEEGGVGIGDAIRKYSLRFFILAVIVAAQAINYNFPSYYVPYSKNFPFGENTAPLIIAISNIGASVGAIPFIWLIDRSRKLSLFASFIFGSATALLIYFSAISQEFSYFLIVLFLNMIFCEWVYGSEATLEGELFPTGMRASAAGAITAFAWLLNTIDVGIMGYLDSSTMLEINFAVWILGLFASSVWLIRGKETAKKPLDETARA